jgi:uncharacterized protein involved in outer membrane biogenesis
MKKILLWGGVLLLVLVAAAAICVGLFLDKAIKKSVETVGPQLTKVSITLDDVSLSILSGSGRIRGLVVGNPEGYKAPQAISVGTASLAVKPSSLFSDKIVVRSINVQAPEITFEGGVGGNNLKQIQANVDAATRGRGKSAPAPTPAPEKTGPSKKLQVDDFVITGGKIHILLTGMTGNAITVPLPDIHLSQLGTGPEGITPGELTRKVLDALLAKSVEAVGPAMTDLSKRALDSAKEAGVEKATKSVENLFKKK